MRRRTAEGEGRHEEEGEIDASTLEYLARRPADTGDGQVENGRTRRDGSATAAKMKSPPAGRTTGPEPAGWPEDGAGNCRGKKGAVVAGAQVLKATGRRAGSRDENWSAGNPVPGTPDGGCWRERSAGSRDPRAPERSPHSQPTRGTDNPVPATPNRTDC